MDTQIPIDLGQIAHEMHLPTNLVQRTVELLDEANTVPFIARFRREQTGGLDEEQIRYIHESVKRRRQVADRKATILKTIEAQGKLTPELKHEIEHTTNLKRLEDLYLPYKPKKQSLASQAKEKGLEPLALAILNADIPEFESQLTELINPEKGLTTSTDVLEGIQHIAAERISERADLRGRLRRIFFRSGMLSTSKIEKPAGEEEGRSEEAGGQELEALTWSILPTEQLPEDAELNQAAVGALQTEEAILTAALNETPSDDLIATHAPASEPEPALAPASELPIDISEAALSTPLIVAPENVPDLESLTTDASSAAPDLNPQSAISNPQSSDPNQQSEVSNPQSSLDLPQGRLFDKPAVPVFAPIAKRKKKKKKKKVTDSAFKDYFNFREPLTKLPPHRVLAINRGERANVLRVKIEADAEAMLREAEEVAVPPDHPHREFLRQCVRDALTRLIIPSLEREARRELSEKAEEHAVEVFVRNLRKLLLQPPVHGHRVLAIDPGFKSGCKLAALDEWGNVLAHGMFYVVGRDDRREKARQRIAEMVRQHNLSVIAIGNGTAGRETEQLVADLLTTELKDLDVAYVTVNEAGASVYSTSPLGREELPTHDAILRSAVSIGRRLLDPLSELVKINPANIGVGLYQHDMKTKHLRESLDAVVESAVNFVGVDANTASPALLRYVSGLNALTARRIYEYRREHGPFKSREDLKQVPGVGDSTYVQAAGFLKVLGGDNPFDATWIHPESYELAKRVLDRVGSSVEELAQAVPAPPAPPPKEAPKFGEGLVEAGGDPGRAADEPGRTGDVSPPVSDEPGREDVAPQGAEDVPPPTSDITEATDHTNQPVASSEESTSPTLQADTPPEELLHANVAGEVIEESEDRNQESEVRDQESEVRDQESEVGEHRSEVGGQRSVVEEQESSQSAISNQQSAITPPSPPAPSPSPPSPPKPNPIAEKLGQLDIEAVATELQVSPLLLEDIVVSLMRPGRDPREELPPPVFRRGIMKLEDLQAGMELQGTVLNVVDFGAFVDIGLTDSGLVHISRLADRYIRDPHEVVGVGDVLKLWVVEVDKGRRRVSLTAIPPGTERPQRPRREERPQRAQRPQQQQHQGGRPQGQRPPQGQGQGQRPQRGGGGPPPVGGPPQGQRPPRQQQRGGGGRRPQGGQRDETPRIIERPATKPKVVKPLTKAQEEGKKPLRSFSDLMQLMEKKKDKKEGE